MVPMPRDDPKAGTSRWPARCQPKHGKGPSAPGSSLSCHHQYFGSAEVRPKCHGGLIPRKPSAANGPV